MLFKTIVTLLAATATVTAIASPQGNSLIQRGNDVDTKSGGSDSKGNDPSKDNGNGNGNGNGNDDNDYNGGGTGNGGGNGNGGGSGNGNDDDDYDDDESHTATGRGGYATHTITKHASCTGRGGSGTVTKTITRTSTIRGGNGGSSTSTPQVLSVNLYRNENCQADGVRREGDKVSHDMYVVSLPTRRTGNGGSTSGRGGPSQSTCTNASNGRDFGSLSFLSNAGGNLNNCQIVVYDDSNCRGQSRSITIRNNERECYNSQDGDNDDDNDNDNSNSGPRGGNGGDDDDEGAQSFRVVCNY